MKPHLRHLLFRLDMIQPGAESKAAERSGELEGIAGTKWKRNPRVGNPGKLAEHQGPELPTNTAIGLLVVPLTSRCRRWVLSPSSARHSQKVEAGGGSCIEFKVSELRAEQSRAGLGAQQEAEGHLSSPKIPLQPLWAAVRRPTAPHSTPTGWSRSRRGHAPAKTSRAGRIQRPATGGQWVLSAQLGEEPRGGKVVKISGPPRLCRWLRLKPVCHRLRAVALWLTACPLKSARSTELLSAVLLAIACGNRQSRRRRLLLALAPDRAGGC